MQYLKADGISRASSRYAAQFVFAVCALRQLREEFQ